MLIVSARFLVYFSCRDLSISHMHTEKETTRKINFTFLHRFQFQTSLYERWQFTEWSKQTETCKPVKPKPWAVSGVKKEAQQKREEKRSNINTRAYPLKKIFVISFSYLVRRMEIFLLMLNLKRVALRETLHAENFYYLDIKQDLSTVWRDISSTHCDLQHCFEVMTNCGWNCWTWFDVCLNKEFSNEGSAILSVKLFAFNDRIKINLKIDWNFTFQHLTRHFR